MPATFHFSEAQRTAPPPRKAWTRAEIAALEAAGLFASREYELVSGDLIPKMGKKRPHIIATNRVTATLFALFGNERTQFESPIDVSPQDNPTSEPEPDVVLLRRPQTEFPDGNPGPSDVALVIEISDTTLAFDLGMKADLYARAGISDYWVIDLNGRRVVVHRTPRAGRYQSVTAYTESESLTPLENDDVSIRVADLLAS